MNNLMNMCPRLTLFTISEFMEQDEIRVSFIVRNPISVHRKSMFHLSSFQTTKKSLRYLCIYTNTVHTTSYNKSYNKCEKNMINASSSQSF